MSFKLGGVDITQIRIGVGIGSAPASKVMLGTGSTAVEVWTSVKPVPLALGAKSWVKVMEANAPDLGSSPQTWTAGQSSWETNGTFDYTAGFTGAWWMLHTGTTISGKLGGSKTYVGVTSNGYGSAMVSDGNFNGLPPGTIPANTWTHVAITLTPGTPNWSATLYINGTLKTSVSPTPGKTPDTAFKGTMSLAGSWADVAAWARPLTASEVQTLYAYPRSTSN